MAYTRFSFSDDPEKILKPGSQATPRTPLLLLDPTLGKFNPGERNQNIVTKASATEIVDTACISTGWKYF